jgi:hypothetical protein
MAGMKGLHDYDGGEDYMLRRKKIKPRMMDYTNDAGDASKLL